MPNTNGRNTPRDLLARRMLALERAQRGTSMRLDITNERLTSLEKLTAELITVVREGFRELRTDIQDLVSVVRTDRSAINDLYSRVIALEAKVYGGGADGH